MRADQRGELVGGSAEARITWCAKSGAVRAGLPALGADVVSFGRADAEATAALRPAGRARGLSLGDRACLAVSNAVPTRFAVTADAGWLAVEAEGVIRLIRVS